MVLRGVQAVRYQANDRKRPLMVVELICLSEKLPMPTPEFRFEPSRRWRFDWCWPDHKIALEIEGAVWTRGRHTRGSGFMKDMEKYNHAAQLGYRVFRCTPNGINLGMELVATALRDQVLASGRERL